MQRQTNNGYLYGHDTMLRIKPVVRKNARVITVPCPLLEKVKTDLLIDMYNTGCIDGRYFGVKQRSKCNGIKEYIKGCLYKQHVGIDSQLVDDCYHVLFEQLQIMDAPKLLLMYNESPSKLLATCLRIIAFKCFAKDNRLGRPNHSLIESVRYASALDRDTVYLSTTDENNSDKAEDTEKHNHRISLIQDDEPEPYEVYLGFRIEELIVMLTDEERRVFYDQLGKQRRGKKSSSTTEEREKLKETILRYKHILQQSA